PNVIRFMSRSLFLELVCRRDPPGAEAESPAQRAHAGQEPARRGLSGPLELESLQMRLRQRQPQTDAPAEAGIHQAEACRERDEQQPDTGRRATRRTEGTGAVTGRKV